VLKNPHEIAHLFFEKDGLLAKSLQGFEERQGQLDMSLQVFDAYDQNEIALVEAGTGIGKSLAYALPAVTWALKCQEKTVISTHTISLQEQLFHKDIPFLLNVLEADLSVVLVKGMSNYLCLKKWEDFTDQNLLFEDNLEGKRLNAWKESTVCGSKSSVSFELSSSTWEKISADSDSCVHVHCPHYKKCHFFKARKQAEDAQVLIVNHHLLLADIVSKTANDQNSVLPSYSRLIVDEAHHLRSIAFEMFSKKVNRIECFGMLHKICSETPYSLTARLLQKLHSDDLDLASKEYSGILDLLQKEIPTQKKDAVQAVHEVFAKLEPYMGQDSKFRCGSDFFTLDNELIPAFQNAIQKLKSFCTQIFLLLRNFEMLKKNSFLEKIKPLLMEVSIASMRMEEKIGCFESFIAFSKEDVRWLEKQMNEQGGNLTIVQASLDVAPILQKHVFDICDSVTLCSATLSTGQNFNYLKNSLGLDKLERTITEKIYHSPFDYSTRSILAVPSDISDPSSPAFLKEALEWIKGLISITKGNAFILFTSYEMLSQCYEFLKDFARKEKLELFRQGDLSRHLLLQKFQSAQSPVLLGTDSFWEGVDIPGDQLKLVIIMKLPFQVPTDPLVQAHIERLEEEGRDPFMEYSVPHAAMKFKQGFGRLIRRQTDRGCVLCLDKRIMTKAYGKLFIKTLPPAKVVFDKKENLMAVVKNFYGA